MTRLALNVRGLPLGVLLLVALCAMIGLGSLAGGVYLVLVSGTLSVWAGVVALVTGPILLYLGYHLLHLARWSWMVLVVVDGLLFLSSLARLALSPSQPVVPLAEMAVELALALYLTRPGVRGLFRADADGELSQAPPAGQPTVSASASPNRTPRGRST